MTPFDLPPAVADFAILEEVGGALNPERLAESAFPNSLV